MASDMRIANERNSDLGAVQVHHDAIAAIARIAAMRVSGVVDTGGSFVDGIVGMIGKKGDTHGIRVEVAGNDVTLELQVIIEFGANIAQLAWQVQSEVRQAVQQMTGKRVQRVDVIVQGVQPPKAKPALAPEEFSV
ncbi:MAG: Asp23/Gls24 family envelope stress response protein [Kiritimatiellaeota bacterium]|nr:Asp23/Gls24 family envelope stress response protein [Kiritimatiellota bacterium]